MMQNKKTYVVCLTGGVGSGKSLILRLLEQEYGAEAVQTDLVARNLEEPGKSGFQALSQAFGQEIVGKDGYLRKDILADMIFNDSEARKKINSLIHPLVWKTVDEWIKKSASSFAVVESAVLPENPGDIFDEIWYVYTLRENRIQRLTESRGYSKKKCLKIMESQMSEDDFKKTASHVIENNGSVEEVKRQIAAIMNAKKRDGSEKREKE